MFYPQNDPGSEVRRDQLLQSSLAYWSTARGEPVRQDPLAWEAGSPVPAKAGTWVWLVLVILIGLASVLALVI